MTDGRGHRGWGRRLPPGLEYVRHLGAGGFGEVVLARQTSLDRLVAVKQVHAGALLGDDEVQRFRREARLLARLDHPTVVGVLDFTVLDGDAVLVMEYVDGPTLEGHVRPGGADPAEVLPVLADVATALAVVAERGISHRDVKPANVFVTADGRGKLGDFGIARMAADPSVFRTTDAGVRGTPAYVAPEAGLGGQEPDARSDAYSFAVMVFELLTGRLPFTADDPLAMLVAHHDRPAPRASTIRPDVPAPVDDLLLAGLSKDPAQRPTPTELVAGIRAALPGWAVAGPPHPAVRTVPAAPTTVHPLPPTPFPTDAVAGLLGRAGARRRRRRLRVGAVVLVAGVAAGAAAVVVGTVGGPDDPPTLAVTAGGVEVVALDPGAACPVAAYRAVARLTGTGGAGTLTGTWVLPDGRRRETPPVDVAAGQTDIAITLDFELTAPLDAASGLRLEVAGPAGATFPGDVPTYPC